MSEKRLQTKSSHYVHDGVDASRVYQIKCPSNAVLSKPAKQRPSSAIFTSRQQSILLEYQQATLPDSFLKQNKRFGHRMSQNNSLKIGQLSVKPQRPKSSYKQKLSSDYFSSKLLKNSGAGDPARIFLSNGVAGLSQPISGNLHKSSSDKATTVSTKKLKPVYQESQRKLLNSATISNSFHKLNIVGKSSAFNHDEQSVSTSNSSSSLSESSGISSALSLCSESLSECYGKTQLSKAITSDVPISSLSAVQSSFVLLKTCKNKAHEKCQECESSVPLRIPQKDYMLDTLLDSEKKSVPVVSVSENCEQPSTSRSESFISNCSDVSFDKISLNSDELEDSVTDDLESENTSVMDEEVPSFERQEYLGEVGLSDTVLTSLDEDSAISECAETEESPETDNLLYQDDLKLSEHRQPALIQSIFSNCPPVINFATHTQQKHHEWLGYFGKHMKSQGFRSLKEYQKMNHYPGSFHLGRKDRLWRNISRMQTRYGKREFGFVPRSYVLPWDKNLLKAAWEEGKPKQKYILKPPASARGIGIKVIHKWNQIPMKKPIMVQKYLSRPYLINGSKFDLRLYVHVTSFDPLRIYVFDDGLVRFATCKYSSSMKHLSNKYMHLTNYSINKKSGLFKQNDSATTCQGHKWSLKALWSLMKMRGVDTDKIWAQMKDIVIKTIISVEQFTNSLIKSNCRRQSCCHELFGFDIMLDDRLKPWLLEVNISPSLHSNSPLDIAIKGEMVKDMFNLCGFLLPDKKLISVSASSQSSSSSAMTSFSQDKRKQGMEISQDSRAKHAYFAQHYKTLDERSRSAFLLDNLTVNDLRVLVESEAESSRCGGFQKIFPSTDRKYLRFFEQPRYYNELLHEWEVKYHKQREKGIGFLESFCRKGYHLLSDPNNVPDQLTWNATSLNHRVIPSPRADMKLGFSHSAGQLPPRSCSFASVSPKTAATLSLTSNQSKSAKNK